MEEKLNKEIEKNPDFVFYDFETGAIGEDLKNFITTIVKEAREKEREKWERKTIVVPKGKTHPVHDKCESCFEIAEQDGRNEAVDYIEKECKGRKISESINFLEMIKKARIPK